MTFSSSPRQPEICVTTRVDAVALSSYKQALIQLQPGDPVSLTDAMGDMVLPMDDSIPLIFVAGGVGVASYAAMLYELITTSSQRSVQLLYSVRQAEDFIYHDLLNAYPNLQVQRYISSNGQRLGIEDILRQIPAEAQIYLSGSLTMVESLRSRLANCNIPDYRIAFDYFSGYSQT